ncbi:hypothetical protein L5515_005349 [Caenorhabditis briggsae]|uniref:Coiled-coil domain-containing protein 25 n=1 Tax=Caenorhabditis briggsae TaxID=6238 RepID=A0AAE9JET6_CAEBR|nr:hypothetical protein L5515_005349 [Caenorhabditis briggsae]
MVFGYFSTTVCPPALIFMGQHQEENERLLKEGLPDDVWFHVDKVPSAHVYLQMPRGITIDTIPEELLDDCCQLVKANSKIGKKMDKATVVYTKRENLKKTKIMDSGEVGFHNSKMVNSRIILKKNSAEILNRLEKTRWKS